MCSGSDEFLTAVLFHKLRAVKIHLLSNSQVLWLLLQEEPKHTVLSKKRSSPLRYCTVKTSILFFHTLHLGARREPWTWSVFLMSVLISPSHGGGGGETWLYFPEQLTEETVSTYHVLMDNHSFSSFLPFLEEAPLFALQTSSFKMTHHYGLNYSPPRPAPQCTSRWCDITISASAANNHEHIWCSSFTYCWHDTFLRPSYYVTDEALL